MRIDILTPDHLKDFEKNVMTAFNNMRKDFEQLHDLVFQLQDRIKMLEDKINEK